MARNWPSVTSSSWPPRVQQLPGAPVEGGDLGQHPGVPGPAGGQAGQQPAQPPVARVLQAAACAANRHAHLGVLAGDAEFGQQPGQQRIGVLVVDDEAGVDGMGPAVRPADLVRVRVPAQPVVGFVQRHVMAGLGQQVGGGQAAHARADDRHEPAAPAGLTALARLAALAERAGSQVVAHQVESGMATIGGGGRFQGAAGRLDRHAELVPLGVTGGHDRDGAPMLSRREQARRLGHGGAEQPELIDLARRQRGQSRGDHDQPGRAGRDDRRHRAADRGLVADQAQVALGQHRVDLLVVHPGRAELVLHGGQPRLSVALRDAEHYGQRDAGGGRHHRDPRDPDPPGRPGGPGRADRPGCSPGRTLAGDRRQLTGPLGRSQHLGPHLGRRLLRDGQGQPGRGFPQPAHLGRAGPAVSQVPLELVQFIWGQRVHRVAPRQGVQVVVL